MPAIPDSLEGYSDMFRRYWERLGRANVWRRAAVGQALESGVLKYLFLLVQAKMAYLAVMTCCHYYHDRDEYFTKARVMRYVGYSHQHVGAFFREALENGHIYKRNRVRYSMTEEGVAWIEARAQQFLSDIQTVMDDVE
jgi:hypothetical protein